MPRTDCGGGLCTFTGSYCDACRERDDGGRTTRAVEVSRHQLLDRRRQVVAENGLSLAWLERLEAEGGTDMVVGWLDQHRFDGLAGMWHDWSWLLTDQTR